MNPEQLYFLQQAMLWTDGMLFAFAAGITFYWRHGGDNGIIHGLFVYFLTTAIVAIALAISDAFVIQKISVWYATLPIIRGLMFRVPTMLAAAYLLYQIHGSFKTR